jgi:colicin import membrane protein
MSIRVRQSFYCALGAALFATGCTVAPLVADEAVLPMWNAQSITDTNQARQALTATGAERAKIAYETREAEIACYKVFYVNSCLASTDWQRKRKEARLREIDAVADQLIRAERAFSKNESIAKTLDERDSKAPSDALKREQSSDKSQEKLESQATKLSDVQAKQASDIARAAEIEASQKARAAALHQRTAKAASATTSEPLKRAKYRGKIDSTKKKQAKAALKQKEIELKPTPAPRLPKPGKAPKVAPLN